MKDLIRDSLFGQQINRLTSGRFLAYADQRPDYVVPEKYQLPSSRKASTDSRDEKDTKPKLEKLTFGSNLPTVAPTPSRPGDSLTPSNVSVRTLVRDSPETVAADLERADWKLRNEAERDKDLEGGEPESEKKTEDVKEYDPFLVGWDGPDDQDNPQYVEQLLCCILNCNLFIS